jgi:branched-subunit amino acid ABC-type transport system permease component
MVGNMIGVLFDGIAYGSLLFLISVGLSVTMGMMNFINLAHGAFAMVGGYVCVTLLSRLGLPFLATLPLAFLAAAVIGLVLERVLYRRLYKASHLDQVLFSIGLTYERCAPGDHRALPAAAQRRTLCAVHHVHRGGAGHRHGDRTGVKPVEK